MFAENSTVEVMQETVRDNVEFLLKKLEESPKKDNLPSAGDVQSPDHYISSVTTTISSLAIHDDPLSQFVPKHLRLCLVHLMGALLKPAQKKIRRNLCSWISKKGKTP